MQSRYSMLKARKKYRNEMFPIELDGAFNLGIEMAEKTV